MRKKLQILIHQHDNPCVLEISILKQEGYRVGFRYTSEEGVTIESACYPELSTMLNNEVSDTPRFFIRGTDARAFNSKAIFQFNSENDKNRYIKNLYKAIREISYDPLHNIFKRRESI